jgi:outer membrane lipoprotein-sorting protein
MRVIHPIVISIKNILLRSISMKKITLVLWISGCLVAAALLLSACGGSSATSSTAAGNSTSKTSSAAAQTTTSTSTTSKATTTSTTSPAATQTSTSTKAASDSSIIDLLKKGDSISSVSYDAVMSGTGTQGGTQKVYLKKTRMRMETSMQGTQSITFIDMEKKTAINYMPAQQMAIKMDFSQVASSARESSDSLMKYNPKVVGTETIDNKLCTIIQYTTDQGTIKQWIWQEKGFYLRVETTTSTGKFTMDIKNLDFSNLDDSLFELPAGVKVTDMGQMGIPSGMPSGIPTNIPGMPTNIPGQK